MPLEIFTDRPRRCTWLMPDAHRGIGAFGDKIVAVLGSEP